MQNKGTEKLQGRASWRRTGPSRWRQGEREGAPETAPLPPQEAERQLGNIQSQKARGNLSPSDGNLHQTASRLPVANQVFLGSWRVDIGQEGRSQRSAP